MFFHSWSHLLFHSWFSTKLLGLFFLFHLYLITVKCKTNVYATKTPDQSFFKNIYIFSACWLGNYLFTDFLISTLKFHKELLYPENCKYHSGQKDFSKANFLKILSRFYNLLEKLSCFWESYKNRWFPKKIVIICLWNIEVVMTFINLKLFHLTNVKVSRIYRSQKFFIDLTDIIMSFYQFFKFPPSFCFSWSVIVFAKQASKC